jgi:hypothetical protein
MMKRTLTALVAGALLLVALPASAEECPTVSGTAVYSFLEGSGVANLVYDGEQVFVPIAGVSFEIEYPFVTRVTSWDFPQGTVDMTEQYELVQVGPNFQFDSSVTVTNGGSGELTWSVASVPAVGLNTIHHIAGSVCVS